MRLLITGGAGFIGSNLAKLALANHVEVTILDDLSTGYRENIDDLDVAFVEASILDVEAVRKSLVGADTVIHLAALASVPRSIQDPMASHAANVALTPLGGHGVMRLVDVPRSIRSIAVRSPRV